MSTLILNYAPPTPTQPRRILPRMEAVVLSAAGIALPLLCFAASARRYPGAPEYQTGRYFDYLLLVPSLRASWPFAPLLFAAVFALAIALISPTRVARSWLLRYAIYSGAVLSLQYTVIQMIALFEPTSWLTWSMFGALTASLAATAFSVTILWLTRYLTHLKPYIWIPTLSLLLILSILLWPHSLIALIFPLMATALIAPALTLAAYLRVALLVTKLSPANSNTLIKPHRRAPITCAWLATYSMSWALAMMNAIELYHSLPTKPPDC